MCTILNSYVSGIFASVSCLTCGHYLKKPFPDLLVIKSQRNSFLAPSEQRPWRVRRGFRASPTASLRPTDHPRLFVLLPSSLHSPLMSSVPSLLLSLSFLPSTAQTQTFVVNPCSDQKIKSALLSPLYSLGPPLFFQVIALQTPPLSPSLFSPPPVSPPSDLSHSVDVVLECLQYRFRAAFDWGWLFIYFTICRRKHTHAH